MDLEGDGQIKHCKRWKKRGRLTIANDWTGATVDETCHNSVNDLNSTVNLKP